MHPLYTFPVWQCAASNREAVGSPMLTVQLTGR
jgi:hypothetical protein